MGSRDRDHAHFWGNICQGHVGTIPENTPAKFEVRTFSRFGTDGQTDRQEQAYQKRQRGYMVIAGHRRPFSTDYYILSNAAMQCIGQTVRRKWAVNVCVSAYHIISYHLDLLWCPPIRCFKALYYVLYG